MNHKLFKFSILFLFILGITSCSDDDDNYNKENDREYELSSIMWKMDSGDGIDTIQEKLVGESILNPSTVTSEVILEPLKNVKETSHFIYRTTEDAEFFNRWIADTMLVSIPIHPSVLSNDYGLLLSTKKAPLVEDLVVLEPSKRDTEILQLSPNAMINWEAEIKIQKIRATFCLVFTSKDNDKIKRAIEGNWDGEFIVSHESNVTISGIKE